MAPVLKNLPVNAGDIIDTGSIPRSGRSPGGGRGNPLQCSCVENHMDRGAWWSTVHGVAKSYTWLKQLSTTIATVLSVYRQEINGLMSFRAWSWLFHPYVNILLLFYKLPKDFLLLIFLKVVCFLFKMPDQKEIALLGSLALDSNTFACERQENVNSMSEPWKNSSAHVFVIPGSAITEHHRPSDL